MGNLEDHPVKEIVWLAMDLKVSLHLPAGKPPVSGWMSHDLEESLQDIGTLPFVRETEECRLPPPFRKNPGELSPDPPLEKGSPYLTANPEHEGPEPSRALSQIPDRSHLGSVLCIVVREKSVGILSSDRRENPAGPGREGEGTWGERSGGGSGQGSGKGSV